MSHDHDHTERLCEQVREAAAHGQPLEIIGSGSKRFYGRAAPVDAQPLSVAGHSGIVEYHPSELVVTARAGTRLGAVVSLLERAGQRLPFEPPSFGLESTLGGVVAAGLSGPRRPWHGAVRDAVLGVRMINGRGEALRFGGQVMKNVAGYDVSRLMAGSLGTLGVLLEVSLKVRPRAPRSQTVALEVTAKNGLSLARRWIRQCLPVTGVCHDGERMWLRLSGGDQSLDAAMRVVGGESIDDGDAFWRSVCNLTHPFFDTDLPLWRISLPVGTPAPALPGDAFIDWAGALYWLRSGESATSIRARAETLGGHATLFRGHDGQDEVFHPLPAPLLALHRRLKAALDPEGIFNPGRLYQDL